MMIQFPVGFQAPSSGYGVINIIDAGFYPRGSSGGGTTIDVYIRVHRFKNSQYKITVIV